MHGQTSRLAIFHLPSSNHANRHKACRSPASTTDAPEARTHLTAPPVACTAVSRAVEADLRVCAMDPSEDNQEDSGGDDAGPTPTGATSRPPLTRISQERLPATSHIATARRRTEPSISRPGAGGGEPKAAKADAAAGTGAGMETEQEEKASSPEERRIAELREAMNAKLLLQNRMRRSYGSPKAASPTARVAAIQAEHEADATQSATGLLSRTGSTDSTGSTRTVRAGELAATGSGNAPLRTPSYPFPYVPGTPKAWPSQLHQPFTALSPTTMHHFSARSREPSGTDVTMSGGSTPAADPEAFAPPGFKDYPQEDPRFPTPNLYDLVLQVNAEPGLEQWWTTVVNMLHDHFKAERATLVIPRDSSEIENVPWGQKASFNMSGREEFVPHRTLLKQMFDAADRTQHAPKSNFPSRNAPIHDVHPQKLHAERFRPRLETRHSYAGHGREASDSPAETRPAGPMRMATHAAGMLPTVLPQRLAPQRFDSTSTQHQSSLGFSSAGVDAGPYAEVFSTLRDLRHEVRPLIESGGVSRILARGRVVTVTRDYLHTSNDESSAESQAPEWQYTKPTPEATPRPSRSSTLEDYRRAHTSDAPHSVLRDYEEYEQCPTSPWSQSPAPSPAIQADEEVNPFFASQEQRVEDAFDPGVSPKDYTQLGQVEAIGVDHASTIIHIPLVHPTISQPMQSLNAYSQPKDGPDALRQSDTVDKERKAPIAILSILTSTVPYPQNLTQILKLLGPHLATSFATSQQFSSSRPQAVAIRQRMPESGDPIDHAPMVIVPTSLEDIVERGKPTGSMSGRSLSASGTSPSDYSGRSPYSATSSIVGTPGWDPATHGWASGKSPAVTPAHIGTETADNYFEAKKRSGKRSTSNAGAQNQASRGRAAKRTSGADRKQTARRQSPSGTAANPSRSDQKMSATEEQHTERDYSPPPESPQLLAQQRRLSHHGTAFPQDLNLQRRHSQLHSYGADVQTSFGGLPSTAGADIPTPNVPGHARTHSYPEGMPPPSERLLRTMIDSVPVQIFTAEPETGKLTWINSKFMVYRGQEAHDVLSEPWQAIHPDDRNEFMASWQRSLRTAQQLQQRVRLKRFDGNYRWFYVRAAPLLDKKQKIVHWIGTMMDFHEQNLAQETAAKQQETAASEAKYRALANSSPQIVFAVSKTKGITFCNTQWVHYSGQSEAQARGVGFMDHVHPDDLVKCKLPAFEEGSNTPTGVPTTVPPDFQRSVSGSAQSSSGSSETERMAPSPGATPITTTLHQKKLSDLAGTGILKVSRDADGRPSYSTEVRLKSKDGEYKWHLVRVLLAEPLIQQDQQEETWYGTCTDITDHKALERDLKETMDEKSRFLSNMSHEIRTPLNGITGMVNFLIDSNLTAEQMEHVNIIRASTEGLRGLINDILDLSKAEAGMISLSMDWLYVRALIEETNDLTSAMAIDKRLELNYLIEEDVPAQIKGDRFRIRQILLNIVGNAIKFTQKGEVFIHCSTYAPEHHDLAENEVYIKFEVVDTGPGFTEEEAELLFKRFSQIDGSSTRQQGGSGLGLVISRQLAQLHGGDMRAKGAPGHGSTFTCVIKATLPSVADQPPTPLMTPGAFQIPILPVPTTTTAATAVPVSTPLDGLAKTVPKFALEQTQSPSPYATSPEVSSAGSERSLISTTRSSSLRSERSSASSYIQDVGVTSPPLKLALPHEAAGHRMSAAELKLARADSSPSTATGHRLSAAELQLSKVESSSSTGKLSVAATESSLPSPGPGTMPPMYSILVVCPLKHSRNATVQHIDKTLPKNVPHQITAKEHLSECQEMLKGTDAVIFTHIVVVLHDVAEIIALMEQVFASPACHATTIVIITDLVQRRSIMEKAPRFDYEQLALQRRLLFVFKPLKPSRFATIFDPQHEREMSLDRNQDSAQQVALTQKQVFEEVTRRLGNKDKRVLLVEDNRTNQLVSFFVISTALPYSNQLTGRAQIPRQSLHGRRHGHGRG